MVRKDGAADTAAGFIPPLTVAAMALLFGLGLGALPGQAGSVEPNIQLAAEESEDEKKRTAEDDADEKNDSAREEKTEEEDGKKRKSYQYSTEPSY